MVGSSLPWHEGEDEGSLASERALLGMEEGGYDSADDGMIRAVGVAAADNITDESSYPPTSLVTTTYSSTRSSSGFLFDVRAKVGGDILIDGLDVNVVLYAGGGDDDGGLNLVVYTREGSYSGYEDDVDAWTVWTNETLTSDRWGGMDYPTRVPSRADHDGSGRRRRRRRRRKDISSPSSSRRLRRQLDGGTKDVSTAGMTGMPLLVRAGTKRSFYVSTPDGPYVRYTDSIDDGRLYYQDEHALIYGVGTAKRAGWDGMTFSPRLFNGAISYRIVVEEDVVVVSPVPSPAPAPGNEYDGHGGAATTTTWTEEDAIIVDSSTTPTYSPTTPTYSPTITVEDVIILPLDASELMSPPISSPTSEVLDVSSSLMPTTGGGGTTTTTQSTATIGTATMAHSATSTTESTMSTESTNVHYVPTSHYYHCNDDEDVDDDDGSSIENDETADGQLATTLRMRKLVVRFDYDLTLLMPNTTTTTTSNLASTSTSTPPAAGAEEEAEALLRAVLGRFEGLLLDYVGSEMSNTTSGTSPLVSCDDVGGGGATTTTAEARSSGGETIGMSAMIRLGKLSSLPPDEILGASECNVNSSSSSFVVADHDSAATAALCYPIAGYMTAYYLEPDDGDTKTTASSANDDDDDDDDDDDNNSIVETTMRDIIHRGIIHITKNDDDVATMFASGEDDAGGGGIMSGTHLAIVSVDRREVPAGSQQQLIESDGNNTDIGLVLGILTAVVVAAALLVFLVARGRSRRRTTVRGGENGEEDDEDEDEDGDCRRGYRHDGGLDDEENRADESVIIPSRRCGRNGKYDGGGRYGNSKNNIIIGPDEDDDEEEEDEDGIGCISLDVGMSEYQRQRQRLQRLPRSPFYATEASLARCDTEATPTISNRTARL